MARIAALWMCFAFLLGAAEIRLYLKEGSFHLVREYKVLEDRVRYYSSERGDWEEIPLDLVDLKKTETELRKKNEAEKKTTALDDAEEKFERALAAEAAMVPNDSGAYFLQDGKMIAIKQAELKVHSDKKRSILKAISPIPVFTGKAALEVEGEKSSTLVPGDRPTFYFRLQKYERFGMAQCTVKKGVRVVENWEIAPVVNIIQATRIDVDIFRQEVAPGLYRVWPQKPLAPGEYALIEYAEGEGNTQAWDFRIEK